MTVYTSRYGNPELKTGAYYVVGITLGKPKFNLGYEENGHCYMLAPDRNMMGMEKEEYLPLYIKKLERLGVESIKNFLRNVKSSAKGKDVVLVCYEDIRNPTQWCHRRMLADWWEEKTGEKLEELELVPRAVPEKEPPEKEKFIQTSLF